MSCLRHHSLVTCAAATVLVFSFLAGCGSSDEADDAAVVPDTTTATTEGPEVPASEITPGAVAERTVGERTSLLYVPESYDPSEPTALVVGLHGSGESPWSMLGRTQPLADEHAVVAVYPAADKSRVRWDFESDADWSYVAAVIGDAEAIINIDPERVYAIGHSQGGNMSTFLACHLGDRLTAVVTNAAMDHHDHEACGDVPPTNLLAIIGSNDEVTSIGGDYIREALGGAGPLPGPWPEEAEQWAATNLCDPAFVETDIGEGVVHREYKCDGVRFEIFVHPGGHVWAVDPGSVDPELGVFGGEADQVDGFIANDAIWDFLEPSAN